MALLDDRRHSRSAVRPGGTARGVEPSPGRAAGHRWERLADAGFYGLAAAVVVLVVVRELTGTTLPAGSARGVVLGACAVVSLVVAVLVLRRR